MPEPPFDAIEGTGQQPPPHLPTPQLPPGEAGEKQTEPLLNDFDSLKSVVEKLVKRVQALEDKVDELY